LMKAPTHPGKHKLNMPNASYEKFVKAHKDFRVRYPKARLTTIVSISSRY
jgi:hypothetical protein